MLSLGPQCPILSLVWRRGNIYCDFFLPNDDVSFPRSSSEPVYGVQHSKCSVLTVLKVFLFLFVDCLGFSLAKKCPILPLSQPGQPVFSSHATMRLSPTPLLSQHFAISVWYLVCLTCWRACFLVCISYRLSFGPKISPFGLSYSKCACLLSSERAHGLI